MIVRRRLAAAAATAALVFTGSAAPVWAATANPGLGVDDVVGALQEAAPETLDQRADVSASRDGQEASAQSASGQTGTVNLQAGEGVELSGRTGSALSLQLPFAEQATDGQVVAPGVIAFDNQNGTITAPVLKVDGSVQVTSIIENKDASQRFDYTITAGAGSSLQLESDGSVTVLSADGKYAGGVAAPWAKDANGAAVATHYEVTGNVLTQVVEHQSAPVAYPVVADPWLNRDLIEWTRWSQTSQGWRLSIKPTGWGWTTGAAARGAAWDEVKAKTPGTRENTEVMEKQLLCHFDGRAAVLIKEGTSALWDLESWRPNVSYFNYLKAQCNPT